MNIIAKRRMKPIGNLWDKIAKKTNHGVRMQVYAPTYFNFYSIRRALDRALFEEENIRAWV